MKVSSKLCRANKFFALAIAYVVHKGITYGSSGESLESILLLALLDACRDFLSNHTNKPMHRVPMLISSGPSPSSTRSLQGTVRKESQLFSYESVTACQGYYSAASRQEVAMQDDWWSLMGYRALESERPRYVAPETIPLTRVLGVGREFHQLNLQD